MTTDGALRLSDLCDRIVETVKPRDRPDSIYLGLEHVPSGRLLPATSGMASSVRSTTTAFRAGDVLYGKLRPYLDKAVLAPSDGVGTTELLVLRPRDGVDPRFLVAVLHAPTFLEYAISGTTGSQHPRTSWAHVGSFLLPDFPPRSRRGITDLVWLVHDALAAVEAAITAGTALRVEAMRTLFTRGLRGEPTKETEIGPMPENWEVVRVPEVVSSYRFDARKQVPKSRYRPTGKWPIVDQGRNEVAGYTDSDSAVLHPSAPVIVFGDHTRIFKYVDHPFAVGAQGTRLLTVAEDYDPRYVYFAFCGLTLEDRGYNRHTKVLMEASIAKPALPEQREIVAILDAIDRKIEVHRRKRALLEQLFRTLLHDLMTGRIRADDLELPTTAAGHDQDSGE